MEKPKAKKSLLQKPSEDSVPEAFWDWQEVSFGDCAVESRIGLESRDDIMTAPHPQSLCRNPTPRKHSTQK